MNGVIAVNAQANICGCCSKKSNFSVARNFHVTQKKELFKNSNVLEVGKRFYALSLSLSSVCMLSSQLASLNVFTPCDNWKKLFYTEMFRCSKVFVTAMLLRSLTQVLWKKSVFYKLSPQRQWLTNLLK